MPKIGETIHGTQFQKSFGGKGANQAVQCARLGVSTAFVGMVGEDSHGKEYIESLNQEGIDTSRLSQSSTHTGIASIWVDSFGRNSIVIVPGANLFLPANALEEYMKSPHSKSTTVVVFQNEIAESVNLESLKWLRVHYPQIVSVFNPAPATEGCKSMARHCDILCLNEVELSFLSDLPTNTDDEVKIAAMTLLRSGCKAVVVTLGDRGAALLLPSWKIDDDSVVFRMFPAEKVKALDSVGAGDSFIGKFVLSFDNCTFILFNFFSAGCLAANIARGISLDTAIQRSVRCATLSVLSKGAQPSYKFLSDIPLIDQIPSSIIENLSINELYRL
jgi:ribokinase